MTQTFPNFISVIENPGYPPPIYEGFENITLLPAMIGPLTIVVALDLILLHLVSLVDYNLQNWIILKVKMAL